MKYVILLGLVLACACTKPNPEFCCLTTEDCAGFGVTDELRPCIEGLACVANTCVVPDCSREGCAADAPVCSVATGLCGGCSSAAECSRFGAQDVCDMGTGACVECAGPADCPAERPVCAANACRGCERDVECPSGACGDDGACIPEAAVLYVDPAGANAGTCPRDAPCLTITFASTQSSSQRNHVVMASGTYVRDESIERNIPGRRLFVHGGGAQIVTSRGDLDNFVFDVGGSIRDLEIDSFIGVEFEGLEPLLVERVRFRTSGIGIHGDVTMRDVTIEDVFLAIFVGVNHTLTLDRAIIKNANIGIETQSTGGAARISNTLIFGISGLALNIAQGTVESTTVVDSGADSGTGPRAVSCVSPNVVVRSSIVWAPGTTPRLPIAGCTLESTIAGPTQIRLQGQSTWTPPLSIRRIATITLGRTALRVTGSIRGRRRISKATPDHKVYDSTSAPMRRRR